MTMHSAPHSDSIEVAVNTAVGTTAEFSFHDFRGGRVLIPSGSGITSLTWHEAEKRGGTYVAAYKEDGTTAIAQTGLAAGRSYPIPESLFASRALKAVGNAAGSVFVSLKG